MTTQSQEHELSNIVRVWDARTGAIVRRIDHGPIQLSDSASDFWLSTDHAVMIAKRRPQLGNHVPPIGPSVLDLLTGAWADVDAPPRGEPIFHPTRRWAAMYEFGEGATGWIVLIDLATGKALWRWNGEQTSEPNRVLSQAPIFIGADWMGVPTKRTGNPNESRGPQSNRLEVWSIPSNGKPPKVFPGVQIGGDIVGSANGRIAWDSGNEDGWIDVFDVDEARVVFCWPPNHGPRSGRITGAWNGLTLSPDGCRVFGRTATKLWEVDSGRELWSATTTSLRQWLGKSESVHAIDGRKAFLVEEYWWVGTGARFGLNTTAIRDFRTGRLLWRSWEDIALSAIYADYSLLVHRSDHTVRSLPPPANYPLLALSQAVLALPLILLWAVLRWRRRRRMRLAGVAP